MNYDDWKTTEPDPGRYDLEPESEDCRSCGAGPDEPCQVTCECPYCLRQRERLRVDQDEVA